MQWATCGDRQRQRPMALGTHWPRRWSSASVSPSPTSLSQPPLPTVPKALLVQPRNLWEPQQGALTLGTHWELTWLQA